MTNFQSIFNKIEKKIINKERITNEEALFLFQSNEIIKIAELANLALTLNENLVKDEVYYSFNININPTNICIYRCPLCAFSKDDDDKKAYKLSYDEIIEKVKKAYNQDPIKMLEVHIVGGINENYNLNFYEKLLKKIKEIDEKITIQGFTAVEIHALAKFSNLDYKEVLKRLKNCGLDAIPGGGAEIFNDDIRKIICPNKINSQEWLKIMEVAHKLNIPTNATMLYGHLEKDEDRIIHLELLRNLQDKTKGFKCFVPLAFFKANTKLSQFSLRENTGADDLKVVAVSRIYLDNFNYIKALPNMIGLRFAQVLLSSGANDLGGTSFDEKIVKAADDVVSNNVFDENDIINAITSINKIPIRTNSTYNLKVRRA